MNRNLHLITKWLRYKCADPKARARNNRFDRKADTGAFNQSRLVSYRGVCALRRKERKRIQKRMVARSGAARMASIHHVMTLARGGCNFMKGEKVDCRCDGGKWA